MLHDPGLILLSILAVGALVLVSRRLSRDDRIQAPTRRKALHVAVGAWTLFVTPHFHHLVSALVPPLLFGIVNVSGKARHLMPGMVETSRDARGLWMFPLGVALTYILFWEEAGRQAILAGFAALAFADPVAAVVGSRFGQRRFQAFGHGRTLEGSAAFFLIAALSIGMIASGSGGGSYPWRMGIGCGAVGAAAEALTPWGWDNVTIPLTVAVAYRLLV